MIIFKVLIATNLYKAMCDKYCKFLCSTAGSIISHIAKWFVMCYSGVGWPRFTRYGHLYSYDPHMSLQSHTLESMY